jgi:hypothetical protein
MSPLRVKRSAGGEEPGCDIEEVDMGGVEDIEEVF